MESSETETQLFETDGGLSPALKDSLIAWAQKHDSIIDLWLFGSRAKGTARPDSDVDLAIVLVPPQGNDNWAFGIYIAYADRWQSELAAIVKRHVSLEAIAPDIDFNAEVRATGVLLWSRRT